MKHRQLFIGMLMACLFFACKNDKPAKTNTVKQPAATQQAQVQKNTELHPLLQQVLPQSQKVEFVFYIKGASMSTETSGKNAVGAFYNFISEEVATKTNCELEGGAVFRAPSGDITMTIDFTLNNGCRFMKVTIGNKVFTQKMSDAGYKYLMQFASIKPQQGTPVPK